MLGGVRAQKRRVQRLVRQTPFPIRMCRAQMRRAGDDAFRPLGMTGGGIFHAPRIVKKDHSLPLHEPAEVCPVTPDQEELEDGGDNAGQNCFRVEAKVKNENVNDDRSEDR